jgi:hypothetical protein
LAAVLNDVIPVALDFTGGTSLPPAIVAENFAARTVPMDVIPDPNVTMQIRPNNATVTYTLSRNNIALFDSLLF